MKLHDKPRKGSKEACSLSRRNCDSFHLGPIFPARIVQLDSKKPHLLIQTMSADDANEDKDALDALDLAAKEFDKVSCYTCYLWVCCKALDEKH